VISALLVALLVQASPYAIGASAQPAGGYQTGTPPGAYRAAPGAVSDEENSSGSVTAAAAGYTPSYSVAPPVALARTGVTIDAYDKSVESRWGADDPFYNGTVRGGAAMAQSRQGQLDGGWTLAGPDGAALYVFQLVDAGEGWLEGAWRAGAKPIGAGPGASGFIALISRESGRVVLRFLEPGAAAPTAVTLEMAADGSWSGQAARGDGQPTAVRMVRR
jgi:hypothetical protein